jgi:hypothetical protein
MKKKSAIQFDPHDYDYLDTLDKDGWHWEFTRRNNNYRKAYDEMERLRKEGKDYCKNLDCFECKVISEKPCPLSQAFYVNDTFQIKPFFKTAFGLKMPDPCIKYSDLPDRVKPVTLIRPITPMKTFTENGLQAAIRTTWEDNKNLFEQIWRYNDPKYAMFTFAKDIFSPNPEAPANTEAPEQTIFIGISTHATRGELRKAFQGVLEKHVRAKICIGDKKLQPEKWKSGLMIWDIRTNHHLSLNEAGYKIDIAEDTARKQYYRAYELIYDKKYKAADFEKPEIKKIYLNRACSTCLQKPTCKDPCTDVLAFVNQDTKQYQREQPFGNMELLTKYRDHFLSRDSANVS